MKNCLLRCFGILISLSAILVQHHPLYSQKSVTIGSETLNEKAVLMLVSDTGDQGFILPKVEDRNNVNPTEDEAGLLVYDESDNKVYHWNGLQWIGLADGGTVAISTLNDLEDVDAIGIATGQVLKWDGTSWTPADDDTGAGADDQTLSFDDVTNILTIENGNEVDLSTLITSASSVWDQNTESISYEAGNVGIGTASPANKLHILNDGTFPLRIESAGIESAIEFANQFGLQGYVGNTGLGTDMAIGTIEGNDTGNLLFLTNNLVRMNLNPSGMLGLGTLNPDSKLDVFTGPADSGIGAGFSLHAIRDGAGDFAGVESRVSSNPSNSGELSGFATTIAGPGVKTGLEVDITNETDEDSYGVKLYMFNTGSNPSYGLFNFFSGSGTGTRYGIYSFGEDQNYLSGDLGIGILAQENSRAKLDVAGDANFLENVHIGTGLINREVMLEVVAPDDNVINEGLNVSSVQNGNMGYTGVTSDVFGGGTGFKSGYRTTLSGNGSKTGLAITISGSGNSNYGVFSSGEDRNYFSGNVGIGTSIPTEKLDVNGNIKGNGLFLNDWEIKQDGLDVLSLSFEGTLKGVFLSTTGQYNMTSDRRLKKGIRPLADVLTKINSLEPSLYQYKNNNPESIESIGFIAQDVEAVFPELVHISADERSKGIYTLDYSGFGVIAIKAIQEQQQIIKDQEERIKVLEEKVERLIVSK